MTTPPHLSRRSFVRNGLAALGATASLGCGSNDPAGPAVDGGSPRLSARPGGTTGTPATGASALGLSAPRDGWLYVPTTYDAATPTPLMVLLHGSRGRADNWMSYQTRAEERGIIALAVDSRDATWDLIISDFGPDIAFLDAALEHAFALCNVDPARLLIGGFSDGASYALSVGLANGDLFSHVLAFSPGFNLTQPTVGMPSVFVSHGDADTILPVNSSRDDIVPDLRARGYDVSYLEFDGGHQVPAEVADAALDWFLGV
ncbi:MAG: phospholipase [Gemmatimonadota bacterium]|nr:phospholipase [Gemmatimonadota bacterium]